MMSIRRVENTLTKDKREKRINSTWTKLSRRQFSTAPMVTDSKRTNKTLLLGRKELIPLGQNQLQQLTLENIKFQVIGKARLSSENYFRGLRRKKIKMMTIRGEGITPSMDTSDE
ncbi:uncharacterized protein LOC123319966 isoform X1 [Coccinella septempunctata]|uniref:uncharacterized protein LOC123319966 isoform X1 n=1 Tax=Coccinella septempunctata TaxID=41139 RepID=UPI001D05FB85|nr:uncharacterized protein LOC123319966 isoform X1 [Coccinella septempunctata]XP_044763003.1 uncharacterized protein LOC123319966 isoform X1 [Coccinella septempunctata]XP_044763004.1 uncharacterized protein LOC123319966 isoform X1 [Coccinella septempunctata]XP_044763005.1 uncharacterized protein LOC123319966 isoform X1 [Coccinella septempunctata]